MAISARSARRARMQVNSFEVLIAELCLLVAIVQLAFPRLQYQTPVGELIGAWGYVWIGCMILAGVGILAGLWFGRADVETFGLVLVVTGTMVQATALLFTVGPSAVTSVLITGAVTKSAIARIWTLRTISAAATRGC